MSTAAPDVLRMVGELLQVLCKDGDIEERVEALIGDEHPAWRGDAGDKLQEFLITRCYHHALATPLVEQLSMMEAKLLCNSAGLVPTPPREGTRGPIDKWLRHHHVPAQEPTDCANLIVAELPIIAAEIDANFDKEDQVMILMLHARKRLEAFLKELLAYHWCLVGSQLGEVLPELQAHLLRHPNWYGEGADASSGEVLGEWIAHSALTAEPLFTLIDKLRRTAGRSQEVQRVLERYISAEWGIMDTEMRSIRHFRNILNRPMHDNAKPLPSRSELGVAFEDATVVLRGWRARRLLPVIGHFKELVQNRWGYVVKAFDLSHWNGSFEKPPPELGLFFRERAAPEELARTGRLFYVYAANNPLAVEFKIMSRP